MKYGAYLTPEKLIAIELPDRDTSSASHNRKMRKAKADLLAKNLRHYCDLGPHKPEDRWVLEKAIQVLLKQA
ncbi:hypothetical protein P4B35_23265 [Pontiellaceae bacterium B12227]|nr:hypothetical protein [Pontiellaceae bacterium B12227]